MKNKLIGTNLSDTTPVIFIRLIIKKRSFLLFIHNCQCRKGKASYNVCTSTCQYRTEEKKLHTTISQAYLFCLRTLGDESHLVNEALP
jgi:hypothetical protein